MFFAPSFDKLESKASNLYSFGGALGTIFNAMSIGMKTYLDQIIAATYKNNPIEHRIALFEYVRELPYCINGRTKAEDVAKEKTGYCVSKHRLLQELFARLGIVSSLCFVSFRYGEVYVPNHLSGRGMAIKRRYHVFLKIKIDGQTLDLDASFSEKFSDYYPDITKRDGVSSTGTFFGTKKKSYTAHNKDEEVQIKKNLIGYASLCEADEKRIALFNEWSLQVNGE